MTGKFWDVRASFPHSQFCGMGIEDRVNYARRLKMKAKAKELMDQGYRRVSNKHSILSRVDRADWKWWMANNHAPWDFREGIEWVNCLGDAAANHYRRVHSKDTLTISHEIAKHVESSGDSSIGYVDLSKPKEKKDMRQLHKFKIHGSETVSGNKTSRGTSKFYDTYEEAEEAAILCVSKRDCEIIIFEAVKIVRTVRAPIVVEDVPKGVCVGIDGAGNPVNFNDEP